MLHCDLETFVLKGNAHCIVIDGFEKTVTKFVIDFEKDSDDGISKFSMFARELHSLLL